MPIDLAAGDLVKQLDRAGFRPPEKLAQQILRAGDAARGALLELALRMDLLHEEEPTCFAPLHALRLLGELPSTDMIEPLLEQYPVELEHQDEVAPRMWADEAPQMIGRIGRDAVAPLWAIVDDQGRVVQTRGVGLQALAYAATLDPSLREETVAGMRERLGGDDKGLNAVLIHNLGYLGVSDLYADVMALFRAGKVETEIIAASTARQLLLTPDEKRLACVKHPLWERYDQHGPAPRPNR